MYSSARLPQHKFHSKGNNSMYPSHNVISCNVIFHNMISFITYSKIKFFSHQIKNYTYNVIFKKNLNHVSQEIAVKYIKIVHIKGLPTTCKRTKLCLTIKWKKVKFYLAKHFFFFLLFYLSHFSILFGRCFRIS